MNKEISAPLNPAGKASAASSASAERPLVAGRDYYLEGDLMIFTAEFLRARGYCCEQGCRHCPYSKEETK